MTAGIVVMNSGAVALAADSVATIPYGLGIKHYRAATKVLGLHTEAPVAVLWYGNPDYVGMPWEVIIKDFRGTNDARHEYVQDYANSFFAYLDQAVPSWTSASSNEPAASLLLKRLLVMVEKSTRDKRSDKITAAVEQTVSEWRQDLRPSAQVLDQRKVDECSELWNWFDHQLALLGPMPAEANSAMRNAARQAWSHLSIREAGHTGLVFAGFGDREQLPSISHYLVGLPAGDHPRRQAGKRIAISASHPAQIVPFAQNDQIRLFMEGLHPNLKRWFNGTLSELQEQYHLDEEVVQRLTRRLADHIDSHGRPVVDAVRFLPKAELAEFARALIAFTAFRLRMSLADESVGEPIDVAVISRGEGLVWVHRSHYFPPELNPHFFRRFR
jgi:hypothetical protein